MGDAIIGDRGQPPSFDAVKKPDFADWNFKLEAFVGNLTQLALTGMSEPKRAQNPLLFDQYDDERGQLAQSPCFQLTVHTEGTPLHVVRKVSNQDGFEAYR